MAYATWNPSDKSARITLSGANLIATADGGAANQAVRGTLSKSTGKWYCEFTCTLDGGLVASVPTLGLANSTFDVGVGMASGTQLGEDANGYGYRKNGLLRYNAGTVGGGSVSWTTGDVISMLFDADGDTLTFWKNGTPIADTFTGVSGTFFPIFHDVGSTVMAVNFGDSAFIYTPTSGYSGWTTDSKDLAISVPPALSMGGGALVAVSVPPTLSMGGGAAIAVVSPSPTLVMGTGAWLDLVLPAAVLAMGGPSTLAVTVPFTVAFGGAPTFDVIVPAPILAMEGDTVFNQLAVTFPIARLEASGETGGVFSLDLTVPVPVLDLATPASLAVSIPVQMAIEAVDGAVMALQITTPLPEISASGSPENLCSLGITASFQVSAVAVSESIGQLSITTPRVRLAATALSGSDSVLAVAIPFPVAQLLGYGPYEGSLVLSYPGPVLDFEMVAAIAAATRTWVLNLRKKGLTEYNNFPFNSYAILRGTVLSAGDGGLFSHASQNSDAGTAISALVRTGEESFGTSFNKRVPRIYLGYETSGAVKFSTFTSQDGQRVYLLPDNGIRKIQQRRIPVGRGPKSPYWQFEVTNVDGADFLLSHMHVYPEKSYRRVV